MDRRRTAAIVRNARWWAASVGPAAPESVLVTAEVQAWWPTEVEVAAEAGGSCGGAAAAVAGAKVLGAGDAGGS